jgi:hypothetical protein
MGKMVRAGAGAGIFDKLEPEPNRTKMDRLRNTGKFTPVRNTYRKAMEKPSISKHRTQNDDKIVSNCLKRLYEVC